MENNNQSDTDHIFNEPQFLLDQGRKAYRIKGDGNCMFRSIAYLATNDDEKHASLRLLLQRFENLNKEQFKKVLTGINKPTIEEHITHIGIPNSWGTHVELFATATYFQVPVYTYTVGDTISSRWEIFRPLADTKSLRYPVTIYDDECFKPPSHFELLYYPRVHYDSIVDYLTEKPSISEPLLKSADDKSVIEVE